MWRECRHMWRVPAAAAPLPWVRLVAVAPEMPGKRFFYSSRYYEWALKLNYSANRLFFNALVYAFSFFLWKLKLARPFGVGEPATKLRYQYSCVCCSFFCEKLQDFFCWRTGNSMPWYHFYVHSWYCANVVVVVSFWIFTAMPVSVCPVLKLSLIHIWRCRRRG